MRIAVEHQLVVVVQWWLEQLVVAAAERWLQGRVCSAAADAEQKWRK